MINHVPIIVLSLFGLLASFTITPVVIKYMKSIGKVGNDVHKIDRPEVAESGGMGFMLIFMLILIIGIIIAPSQLVKSRLTISLAIIVMVTIIGLIDDFKGLSARAKPLLLIVASLPVFFWRTIGDVTVATPFPVLPFVGPTQLTIVYWGLAIFVIAIPANASNMLDVMNGVMSGSGILIMATAFISSFIIPIDGKIFTEGSIYYVRFVSLAMMSVLVGFWWYNRYPAKVFAGDTGSLGVGATIGLVAIYGQLEFVMVVALLVHIMNSFSIISSVRGLRERREMVRPVKVENGIITASRHQDAPITLVRLIVARGETTEDKVITQILFLVAYCCLLALISAFLIRLEVIG